MNDIDAQTLKQMALLLQCIERQTEVMRGLIKMIDALNERLVALERPRNTRQPTLQ